MSGFLKNGEEFAAPAFPNAPNPSAGLKTDGEDFKLPNAPILGVGVLGAGVVGWDGDGVLGPSPLKGDSGCEGVGGESGGDSSRLLGFTGPAAEVLLLSSVANAGEPLGF